MLFIPGYFIARTYGPFQNEVVLTKGFKPGYLMDDEWGGKAGEALSLGYC